MKLRYLLRVLLIGFSFLWLALFSLLHIQAQGVMLTKTLNKSSPVVRVGELISFTITLNNNAGFVLTNVRLIDIYRDDIMAFAGATPAPDVTAPGTIEWTNVAAPPIALGETLTFTVFFTVEHPQNQPVVNQVEARDIMGGGTAISNTASADQADRATGNQAPVLKFLSPPGSVPQAGLPLTFTQVITNDGLAVMTVLPLTDTYDPNFLQFNFAVPPPDIVSPGQLVWTDLTDIFGDLDPFQTIVITTVFTATTEVLNTTNQARVAGAMDEFNNILDEGRAQVGILIIGDETEEDLDNNNDNDNDDDDDEDIPAPAPTVAVLATPTPLAVVAGTSAVSVTDAITTENVFSNSGTLRYLPETGEFTVQPLLGLLILGLMIVLVITGFIMKRKM